MDWLSWSAVSVALGILALSALAYTVLALWQVHKFRVASPDLSAVQSWPAISVLRPLCGAEPRLYESLKSFFEQDYPDYHLVFGVRDRSDPAMMVVERLCSEFPDRAVTMIVDARVHGANLKVSNLMNMMGACRHPLLVIADSDVFAQADTLRRMAAMLAQPKVGAVTCVYTGVETGSLASKLGAMFINDWFLPSALVDVSLNGVDGCYGPLTAIRRSVLDDIGGFSSLANFLAEDNRMGRMVRAQGLTLELDSLPVPTMVNARRVGDLLRHELRWARTVRSCRPKDHVLSLVMFPLPVLLALLALDPTWVGTGAIGLHLVLRMMLNVAVRDKIPATGQAAPLWVPLRECLCFLVWALSLRGNIVLWRGTEYRLVGDGSVVPVRDLRAPLPQKLLPEEGA